MRNLSEIESRESMYDSYLDHKRRLRVSIMDRLIFKITSEDVNVRAKRSAEEAAAKISMVLDGVEKKK